VWRDHFGEADETGLGFNGDGGDIGLSDYAYWRANYGRASTLSSSASAPVPEPGALVLVVFGTILGLTKLPMRRRSAFYEN
jgi:hypothetical protein